MTDTLDKCGRCGVELNAGASHQNESACIDALKHQLEVFSSCGSCQEPLTLCVACSVKKAALSKLGEGALYLYGRAMAPKPERKKR